MVVNVLFKERGSKSIVHLVGLARFYSTVLHFLPGKRASFNFPPSILQTSILLEKKIALTISADFFLSYNSLLFSNVNVVSPNRPWGQAVVFPTDKYYLSLSKLKFPTDKAYKFWEKATDGKEKVVHHSFVLKFSTEYFRPDASHWEPTPEWSCRNSCRSTHLKTE